MILADVREKPFILLTTLAVETLEQTCQIFWYHETRWSCVEGS
jgi:hypothetical protein